MKGKNYYLINYYFLFLFNFHCSHEYEKKIVKLLESLFTQMNILYNDNDEE